MKRLVRAACALLLCLGLSGTAQAGGFSALSLSPDHFTAVTTTPVASYTNPAALLSGEGLRLFIDGNLVYRRASYDRASSDIPEPMDGTGANVGEAKLTNLYGAPTMSVAYTKDRFGAGVGVFIPFGGAASWNKDNSFQDDPMYVGAVDSTARWHVIEGLFGAAYLTGALAYEIVDGLSLGASYNFVYTRLELTQAMTAALDDKLETEGRNNLKLDGTSGSFGVGLLWEVLPDVAWFGLSYQSPPGFWKGVRNEGPLETNFGTGINKENIRLDQDFPDIVQAGLRLRPHAHSPWELRLTGNYQRFSAVKSQCLARTSVGDCKVDGQGLVAKNSGPFANFVRRWNDTFGARIAGSYFFGSRHWGQRDYEIFGALSYDGNAVPDAMLEPGMFDGHELGATLGARVVLGQYVLLAASYSEQYMLPRNNEGESELATFDPPNKLPSANGSYKQSISLLNVNLEVMFKGL